MKKKAASYPSRAAGCNIVYNLLNFLKKTSKLNKNLNKNLNYI
nr:MAG TPA: hypothetical protein [Caudoviricetes sp.]